MQVDQTTKPLLKPDYPRPQRAHLAKRALPQQFLKDDLLPAAAADGRRLGAGPPVEHLLAGLLDAGWREGVGRVWGGGR
jgi:hypothetical protein